MHEPVMVNEAIEKLSLKKGDIIFDGTCGAGGHDEAILKRILPGGRVIAVDKDRTAIEAAKQKLAGFKDNITFVHSDFRKLDTIIADNAQRLVNGAIFDLGVSSGHLDESKRGFSFRREGPLDMRMNQDQDLSACDVVNRLRRSDLEYIISHFGEERHAKLIARSIERAREKEPITTTGKLEEIIYKAVGRYYKGQKLHPAARTFQALRIYVNDELGALEKALDKLDKCIERGGRVCFISFHSLEDRIVKRAFKDLQRQGSFKIITKKPLRPQPEERKKNPRSRSAKLRVAERI